MKAPIKVIFVILSSSFALASSDCDKLSQASPGKQQPELVQPAMRILHQHKNAIQNDCLLNAVRLAGKQKVVDAIPYLIEMLDWEEKSRDRYKFHPKGSEFPAIDALFQIGEPAVPSLIRVLAEQNPNSNESRNALHAFMLIHRDDLAKGIQSLKEESQRRSGVMRQHLKTAAANGRKMWCSGRSDCATANK